MGVWTLLGLFFSLQAALIYIAREDGVRWGATLVSNMSEWYAWGMLAPLILRLARRYPLGRQRWQRSLRVHVLVSLALAPLHIVLGLSLRYGGFLLFGVLSMDQISGALAGAPFQVLVGGFDSFFTYWIILAVFYTFDYYQKYREREVRASQLEAQLALAQLTALKMQLHPHFLFNTLHGISTLVSEDPEAAERMIARLSDLLRLTLENEGTQEVSLRQELAFLERYLEIERMRFPDRLSVEVDVEPGVMEARVPNLILQPLVENAIRHGIAPRPTPGSIRIRAERANGSLKLQVQDDGPGLTQHTTAREGVGLANTRARLEQLYGLRHQFELHNGLEGGLEVNLTLPYHTDGPPLHNGHGV